MIKIGDKAPEFKLFNTEKSEVSLNDFIGKHLVIHFFPAAFTGVCTNQLCCVRDAIHVYQNDQTNVLAISVDSLFTLAKFKEVQQFNFALLSDFNKVVCKMYGAYYEEFVFGMKGVARRAAFVVDKTGIVRYVEIKESAGDLPDFNAINNLLKELE